MKTAISIPDDLYRSAEDLAKKLKLSRSGLYSTAISEFLERRGGASLRKKIDEVCREVDTSLDSNLHCLQADAIRDGGENW